MEVNAVSDRSSLQSIYLSASLQIIDGLSLSLTDLSTITVEEGDRHFGVWSSFLLGFEGISALRYFGSDSTVSSNRSIEILSSLCFSFSHSLCSFPFEFGSKLSQIEANAFSDCSSLESVSLPASVEFLGVNSFSRCFSLSSFTAKSIGRPELS
jgi:hypothetical protein